MTITFNSEITQPGNEKQVINFKAPVTTSEEHGFKVMQFTEPNTKILTRVEISPAAINIFSGTATLNLQLNTDLQIEYNTDSGSFYLTSHLQSLKMAQNKYVFEYTLKQKSTLVGAYKITLTLNN